MNYLFSFIFSAIEFSSLIILTMAAFRFTLLNYKKEIAILSISLSLCSLIFDLIDMQSIAPIVQLIVLIVLFKAFIRESILYSALVNILGFLFFNVIEAAFFLILKYYNIADISDLGGTHNATTYTLQLSASLIILIVSTIIRNMNQGFGFADKFKSVNNKKIKTTNKVLVVLSFISILLLSSSLYMLLANKNLFTFMAFLIFLLVFNLILFYFYNKRDKEQYSI